MLCNHQQHPLDKGLEIQNENVLELKIKVKYYSNTNSNLV